MYPFLTLLTVMTLLLVGARIATRALVHTGMSAETARFQSWSALSGVGFTTKEAESVVNHPVRRHLVMFLMLMGNVGVVTLVSSFVLAFMSDNGDGLGTAAKAGALIAWLFLLWGLAASQWVDRKLKRIIDRALKKYTHIGVNDYGSLLDLSNGYRVTELFVDENNWLAGRTLSECSLRQEGLNILGVHRGDGSFDGDMTPQSRLHAGDNILLYGRLASIESIDQRRRGDSGDLEHVQAMKERKRSVTEAADL